MTNQMTAAKAIEILQDILNEGRGLSREDCFDAVKLGLIALRACQKLIELWDDIPEELALTLAPFLNASSPSHTD